MRASIVIPLLVLAAPASAAPQSQKPATLEVTSPAFTAGQDIPIEYTCEGSEKAPPLSWSKVPANTKSIAILVVDPDAPKGTFTHWLVTGIPPTVRSLDKGAALPEGAIAAKNDKGNAGYAGPCPPTGRHHYHFRVFALDIGLDKQMTKTQFMNSIAGHVLAEGELVATYKKQR